jgi:hypothetical protein
MHAAQVGPDSERDHAASHPAYREDWQKYGEQNPLELKQSRLAKIDDQSQQSGSNGED